MTEVLFTVVHSDDGRVSIWPTNRDIPWGWQEIGFSGIRQDCLSHIEQTFEMTLGGGHVA